MTMKKQLIILLFVLMSGCSTVPVKLHETKFEQTPDQKSSGSLCDLFVKLDGDWVKFCDDIGDYSLCQSPDGRYLVLTDFRGYYKINIKVYDTQTRELFDITDSLRVFLPSLSDKALFTAKTFIDNETVEFDLNLIALTQEEEPIVEALNKCRFKINVHEIVEVKKSR